MLKTSASITPEARDYPQVSVALSKVLKIGSISKISMSCWFNVALNELHVEIIMPQNHDYNGQIDLSDQYFPYLPHIHNQGPYREPCRYIKQNNSRSY